MRIVFWGVRGSFPLATPHPARYGGNTPCVEVDTGQSAIIIDAGTGIRAAGRDLLDRGTVEPACEQAQYAIDRHKVKRNWEWE